MWHRKPLCSDTVLKHCAANTKRRLSALPNVGQLYDISRLWVNPVQFVGVRGLTTLSYILYDYTTSGHKGTVEYICNVYIYIQYTYISIQYIYLFLMHWNWKGLTSYIFGTVHSDRTVVVLLHKYFLFRWSAFCQHYHILSVCCYKQA